MMKRRAAMICLALAACGLVHSPVMAATRDPVTGLTLRETLEKGLKARRSVEFNYLRQITNMVDRGQLPEQLVFSTFVWARQQPGRPLQRFQFALYERARKKGYRVPQQ